MGQLIAYSFTLVREFVGVSDKGACLKNDSLHFSR